MQGDIPAKMLEDTANGTLLCKTQSKPINPNTMRSTIFILLLMLQVGYSATPSLFREEAFTCASFAEAVNHFVTIGEDAAVPELLGLMSAARTDINSGFNVNERVAWMCRVLFSRKDAEPLREPPFGGLDLPYHTMPLKKWPLYPVALSGSTYFVLSEGYSLGGFPGDPRAYVEYCRKSGVFRKTKVTVPTREKALKDAADMRRSKAWTEIKWKDSGENWSYKMLESLAWEFIQKQAESIR